MARPSEPFASKRRINGWVFTSIAIHPGTLTLWAPTTTVNPNLVVACAGWWSAIPCAITTPESPFWARCR